MTPVRRETIISPPDPSEIRRPEARVRRFSVRPRSQSPVLGLVATPRESRGLTLHFIGYNVTMGPWEAAKCALWAARSGTTVVAAELPGFSRYGHPLPGRTRTELLDDNPVPWATAAMECLDAVIRRAGVAVPDRVDVLAFSTGCSLAVAAWPAIQALYPVASLTLVEPVAIGERGMERLTLDNVIDQALRVRNLPGNLSQAWIREAARRQLGEPGLKAIPPDAIALLSLLSSDDTRERLATLDLGPTNLVRGALSQLSREREFAALDSVLESRGVAGTSATVAGCGHQLWHSFPVVAALADALAGPADLEPAGDLVGVGGRQSP